MAPFDKDSCIFPRPSPVLPGPGFKLGHPRLGRPQLRTQVGDPDSESRLLLDSEVGGWGTPVDAGGGRAGWGPGLGDAGAPGPGSGWPQSGFGWPGLAGGELGMGASLAGGPGRLITGSQGPI